ncbi:MAG: FliI/YscN family ATPase [Desulfobacterales bacterium]|nr:FliI/YscN family ATPase [Desulfobacterales bacterium]MBF0397495.1 FliI/YscN family ATPase [Desulfobacterales bacterium]
MVALNLSLDLGSYFEAVEKVPIITMEGRIIKIVGLIAEGVGLGMGIGSICTIQNDNGENLMAEVIGFKDDSVLLMPYGSTRGIRPGCRFTLLDKSPKAAVGDNFLGRVVDGMGNPIDGMGTITPSAYYPLYGNPINPMQRRPIKKLLDVGVAAINSIIPLGRGQRVAIMAGSGVGKSVLMGMMTKHTKADVTIIGLIGERGREVSDFVCETLGKEGIKRAVVVAATSDSPPLVRMRGAYLSTTLAEFFRDQGKDVLLIIDSITRYAMSSRDVGLAAGEPPTTKGYTPSFFAQIPVLLERAGSVEGKGSITGIYTVLVEGDDMNDPVGDTVRSIVDGHIVLSRKLANRGHYPAIEVLESVSRVMRDVISRDHLEVRSKAIDVLATYKGAEDMISIGAYVNGSDAKIDFAKKMYPQIVGFLRQEVEKQVTYEDGLSKLKTIFQKAK